MAIPDAPTNMDEFQKKAQAFTARAKAEGKSNTAIANTLKFMYGLTQQAIENQQATEMTPYQQATIDLAKDTSRPTQVITDKNDNQILIDTQTGEQISSYGDEGSTEDFESQFSVPTPTGNDGNPVMTDSSGTPVGSLDINQFAKNYQGSQILPQSQPQAQTSLTPEQNLEDVNKKVFTTPEPGVLEIDPKLAVQKTVPTIGEFFKRGFIPGYQANQEGR